MVLRLNYKDISIDGYDYHLDDIRIAKYPLEKRDDSKLLIYKNNNISTSIFSSIVNQFAPNDLLVFNNTKVVQARLLFRKSTGALIEIFLLSPNSPSDYQVAFSANQGCQWECIVGNLKRWKGEKLVINVESLGIDLTAGLIKKTDEGAIIEFNWNNKNVNFAQIIEQIGQVPIPPYLNRKPEEDDKLRYQTVYAKPEGSVAAPTAGLHFTNELLKDIRHKGIKFEEVTLHVGAGTFRPVKADNIGDHDMHTERFYVTKQFIDSILNCNGRIFSVGTTSMRTLESLYWLGVKLITGENSSTDFVVNQWDGYTLPSNYTAENSLYAIKKYLDDSGKEYIDANTCLLIVPGYEFKVVDVLITNFHQPRSTLLLLVAAFIGDDWRNVYQYALDNSFRFLSYGDSSILFRNK